MGRPRVFRDTAVSACALGIPVCAGTGTAGTGSGGRTMARIIPIGEPANEAERMVLRHLREQAPDDWIVVANFELPYGPGRPMPRGPPRPGSRP